MAYGHFVIIIHVLFFRVALGKVDFCFENKYPEAESGSKLTFTKELSGWEYAVESKFKSLHCCAKGYRSVEWYKDGKPYPWAGDSSLILYPASANQTIYAQSVRSSDAGNYTCLVHNDTSHIVHHIELTVFDTAGYMETPLANYRPPPISYAPLHRTTRLFCEAFVGHIDLPDATSKASWVKLGESSLPSERFHVQQVERENGQVIGAYLNIGDITWSDYGTYICIISNTGDQKITMETQLQEWPPSSPLRLEEMKIMAGILIGLLVVLMVFIIVSLVVKFFTNYQFRILSIWRKIAEKSSYLSNDHKKTSVMIIFHEKDKDFVENTLLPQLQKKSCFEIIVKKISPEGDIHENFITINKIEKNLLILSKNVTREWTQLHVITALQALVKVEQHCIISLEVLPSNSKDENNSFNFENLMKRYRCLTWPGGESPNIFWGTLYDILLANEQPKPTVVNINEQSEPYNPYVPKIRTNKDVPEVHV